MKQKKQLPDDLTIVLESVLQHFPEPLHASDHEGRIVYANDCACDLLGYTKKQLTAKSLADLYAGPQPQAAHQSTSDSDALQTRIRTREGEELRVSIRSFPITSDHEDVRCVCTLVNDTRQHRNLVNDITDRCRIMATSDLAAVVAHDISNPLSVIKLYGEWLIDEAESDDAANQSTLEEGLKNIQQSATRIEAIVESLRDFSRSVEDEPERFDLRTIVDNAVFFVGRELEKNGVAVVRDLPSEDCPICACPMQLEHAFSSVLFNACEALRDIESPEIRIEIASSCDSLNPDDTLYECSIVDNGAGMPTEIREHAFQAFFSTHNDGNAPGLGLSIARNIIRRHGGDISLNSEPGQGTDVTFHLPASLSDCE
ncbi:MAG: PAS domain-containing sensor histidine kinase [Candidatus Pacebacteria bacterium]|nr:PAS domain-containing sensor histidine kinase [Candidatus Paceibacterota bacterium]